jgi:hypothetical protein
MRSRTERMTLLYNGITVGTETVRLRQGETVFHDADYDAFVLDGDTAEDWWFMDGPTYRWNGSYWEYVPGRDGYGVIPAPLVLLS